jgi:hypothetical protein
MRGFLTHVPSPMFPGLIAFFVGFVLQFVIRTHVDREKIARSDSFWVRNYFFRVPPREALTQSGLKLYWWLNGCYAVFIASIVISWLLSWNGPKV